MNQFKAAHILMWFFLIISADVQAQSQIKKEITDSNNSLFNPTRFGLKLDLGAGFVSGSNSGMLTYIAPQLRYAVTPKFRLDVGGMLIKGSINRSSGILFARGNYLMTKRLTVSGSVYKSFLPDYLLNSELKNEYSKNNYSYSIGMDYKINEHMTFGAQVIMAKGVYNNTLFRSQPSLFGGIPTDNFHSGIMGW